MPLPTFKTKDEIPEPFRDGYVERDGEWVPDVEDVDAIKRNRAEMAADLRKLKGELKALQDAQKARESGLTDEQIAQRRAEEKALTEPLEQQIATLTTELRTIKLDGRVKSMFAEAGANPKRLGDLFKLVGDRFDLSESGSPVLKAKPTEDLGKYVADTLSTEYPEFFLSKSKGGDQFPGGAGGPAREDVAKMVVENPGRLLALGNKTAA